MLTIGAAYIVRNTLPLSLFIFIVVNNVFLVNVEAGDAVAPNFKNTKDVTLPPCAACRALMESFNKGLAKTANGKFEGGDAAWESDTNSTYKSSELRLVEIQESLCSDLTKSQSQCHQLAEELESYIEDWWFNHQTDYPNIFDYVCIEKVKRCCPKHHFGPNCDKCPGFPDKICRNNGKCKGDGTRKGNGGCFCDKGYAGEDCFECAKDYYESYRDEDKLLCSPCHKACEGGCGGPGTGECEGCKEGWRQLKGDKKNGCVDINECTDKGVCRPNEFCVNTEGSYYCLACDRACNGCTGDGPDMCIECSDKYTKVDNICVHAETINKKKYESMTRYATYFGLGLATCIIFQRNVYVAGLIGFVVSAYIAVSEYTIYHDNTPDLGSNMNFIDSKT